MRTIERIRRTPLLASIAVLAAASLVGTAAAALQGNENAKKAKVIVGADNDEIGNGTIQPIPSPPGADQSLKKSDQIFGGLGPDTLIGRLGSDVFKAGAGDDVIVGGTEGGQPAPALPNSDIAYGQTGSDAFIWAPGDGSDAFIGGDAAKAKKTKAKKGAKGKKVKVKRRTALAGPRGDRAHRVRVDGSDAVDGRTDAGLRVRGGHLFGPSRPAVDVAVGEALLHRVERAAVEARPQIARVEQDQPDPR